jgi:long-chain acyl-CoA synthetase
MKSLRPFKRVVRSIRKNRVTIFVGIPSIYNILKEMKIPGFLSTPLVRLFNPLRICISGAAALPAETLTKFERKFRIPLVEGYGLTEASPVVTLNPVKGKRKAGSIGVPLARHIKLKVVDEKLAALGTGEIGELLVKGPNVMKGYFRQEAASQETIKDGWLCTGDMAKIDPEGYVFIVGRKKEMVNVRGLNVYPREIEEVLYQNPKVKEAAVIGVIDEHKGEVPKGFIVLKDGEHATEHEIILYLRERLAGYKIPKHIEFRADLPKNTTGKILKRLLQNGKQEKD